MLLPQLQPPVHTTSDRLKKMWGIFAGRFLVVLLFCGKQIATLWANEACAVAYLRQTNSLFIFFFAGHSLQWIRVSLRRRRRRRCIGPRYTIRPAHQSMIEIIFVHRDKLRKNERNEEIEKQRTSIIKHQNSEGCRGGVVTQGHYNKARASHTT